ncbi:DUF4169 family protein [Lichenihabitans psoromatis]|uniref:DUF4169 family protein n=1 Tax=Lichenihabitans psoromatis TaxID=2528642 RepID=UPI001036D143|nr:DUF4169 family protein [Lichenihabitans psoromatis]
MGDLVNLRLARKRRDREAAAAGAEQNRISFGRGKAERRLSEAEKALADRSHAAHRRSPDDALDDPDRG